MQKVINSPNEAGKKREGHKRKEQCGVLDNTKSSQSRARVREYLRVRVWDKRRLYDEAGAAADEIMATCFGSLSDHNKWAARMYEYPWAIKKFVETAHEKASCYRTGKIRNPVTAFQAWINKHYPKMKGGAV